jgi:hypothetical protein
LDLQVVYGKAGGMQVIGIVTEAVRNGWVALPSS